MIRPRLIVTFVAVASCGGSSEDCALSVGTINGLEAMDVSVLANGADINEDLAGVQVAVRVDTRDVDDGTTVQLEVQHPDGTTTTTEAEVVDGEANFPVVDLGLEDGAVTLAPAISERECATSSHAVVLQAIRCAITAPIQGEALNAEDDLDRMSDNLQTRVRVATNAPNGATAALSIGGAPSGSATVQGFAALFDSVALPDMEDVTLDVTVMANDGSSALCSVTVDVNLGFSACTLEVPAADVVGTLGPVLDATDDVGAAPGLQTDVLVSTDAAQGSIVELLADEGSLGMAALAGGTATFAAQTLAEGPRVLRASCRDVAGNEVLSPPVAITVDSIPPAAVDDLACAVLDRRLASLRCQWTAPAESGTGLFGYDVRYLAGGAALTTANFASAAVALPSVAPVPPGATQEYVIAADDGNAIRIGSTYDVALVAIDAAGNRSALSTDIAPLTPTFASTTIGAEDGTARFGYSLASGDFNCDGFGDLAVGAPDVVDMNPGPGRVYLYFGGAGGLPSYYDSRIFAASSGTFGIALAALGNFDDDTQGPAGGCDDLAVSANLDSSIYIYLGRPAWFDRTADDIGTGAEVIVQGENAGWSGRIAGGDVNGDGRGDLLYGVHDVAGMPPKPLRVQALFGRDVVPMAPGGAPMRLSAVDDADVSIDPGNDLSTFGGHLSTADMNADGFDDVLIGHYDYDVTPNDDVGAAYVVFGAAVLPPLLDVSMPSLAFSRVVGGPNNIQFGAAVSSAGDSDGDGMAELAVGDYDYSLPAASAGIAYIFSGVGPGVLLSVGAADSTIDNGTGVAAAGDKLGWAIANGGERFGQGQFDIDGDGLSDLAVTEHAHGTEVGSVLVYFGDEVGPVGDSNTRADLRLAAPLGASSSYGTALITAGDADFNADGFPDLVVSDAFSGTCSGVGLCGSLTAYW